MPVLAVVTVAAIVLLAAAVLFAVIHVSHIANLQRIPFDPRAYPFTVLTADQAFDPEQSVLWSTQLPALEAVATARKGLTVKELYVEYQSLARSYPELYDGSSFGQWLDFLVNADLVVLTLYRASLTARGEQLIHFLEAHSRIAA